MKSFTSVFPALLFILVNSHKLYAQPEPINKEFGITTGAFTNFPANKDYLNQNISVFYVAPYVRAGQHEFSAGMVYPLATQSLNRIDSYINPRPGAVAGYKFYLFDAYGRENMFIHYSFQYLRFKESYDMTESLGNQSYQVTETDMYVNNVIGLGYNLFFDMDGRFAFYYTLDYVISQAGFKINSAGHDGGYWATQYTWNNLSTGFGLIFKLTSLNRKVKKETNDKH
jgi:hypothetical protein